MWNDSLKSLQHNSAPNLTAGEMYLSIFCSSIAVCMFATLFSALLPLDQLQKMLPILSHTIASHQIQFRENLLNEVATNPSHWILWIFLRYAARVFVYCGKEIISLVTVFHFVPTITSKLIISKLFLMINLLFHKVNRCTQLSFISNNHKQ